MAPMERLLAYQRPTREVYHDATRWDQLMPFAQSAFTRQEYAEAATLVTGMLAHLTGAGEGLRGAMLIYDGLYAESRRITTKRRAECPVCGGLHR